MKNRELNSAVVLCGGMGRRMGSDKGLLVMDGRTFIEIITDRLLEYFTEVAVVLRDSRQAGNYRDLLDSSISVLTDEVPGVGPLGGIFTALGRISGSAALFLPCDSPLVTREFLLNMKDAFRVMGDRCDAIVPCRDGLLEPLHSIYSVKVRDHIEGLLAKNERRVRVLLDSIESCRLDAISLDPTLRSFRNFNRPEDLRI
ncbi:molybdenum cofactor guanylyltransferase [Methanothermobacter sp. DP]|uniref:molybdenum cofactor guanylyltransferase n=1 Tax=Methanothermobacter sp. DP TaxID=2998972 RepID=UPI002AA5C863|nr:molybdenum cofactor guanylyltransferase [Methanothermobacter sp. DP]